MIQQAPVQAKPSPDPNGPKLAPSVVDVAFNLWQSAGQPHWHVVRGISMWPFLRPADRVLVLPNTEHLAVGEVVLIRFNERLVVHRIAQINEAETILTWGDFNLQPDPLAAQAQILGKVIKIERNQRQISLSRGRHMWGQLVIMLRLLLLPGIRMVRWLIRARQWARQRMNHKNL